MKKVSFALVGAAALALAACGGQGDDALGDNVADNYDAAADNLDAMADTLRDLPQIWGSDGVALLWEDAERLAAHDGRAWWILGEILDDADDLTVVALGEARLGRPTEEDR